MYDNILECPGLRNRSHWPGVPTPGITLMHGC